VGHRGEENKTGMDSYTGFQTVTKPKRAVVVGGGFIGLEMVENFAHLGLEVTLIEKLNQVMPPLDPEMARLVERYLVKHGVNLQLSDGVAGFRQTAEGALEVLTESEGPPGRHRHSRDRRAPRDGAGESGRPRNRQAGGIRVDEHMRTSDPNISRRRRRRSKGLRDRPVDAHPARRTGEPAGPHRRRRDSRARLALSRHARHVDLQDLRGRDRPDGPERESPAPVGRPTSRRSTSTRTPTPATTRGQDDGDQGPLPEEDGRLLGAQLLSEDGVAKRVDAFAMAIQMKATIHDLEEAELCYAPPFGSAKDPVNFAGMVAGNLLSATCRSSTGTAPARGSSSTCAILRSSRSSPSRRTQHPPAAAARTPRGAPEGPRDFT